MMLTRILARTRQSARSRRRRAIRLRTGARSRRSTFPACPDGLLGLLILFFVLVVFCKLLSCFGKEPRPFDSAQERGLDDLRIDLPVKGNDGHKVCLAEFLPSVRHTPDPFVAGLSILASVPNQTHIRYTTRPILDPYSRPRSIIIPRVADI